MSSTLPLIVIGLVIVGMSTSLIIRSSGSASWLIKLFLAVAFIAVLVLNSFEVHRGLIDHVMALIAQNNLHAAAYVGGVIVGTILPRR